MRLATKPPSTLLDKTVLVVALAEPLTTIGQIWQLWTDKSAAGNSLITWGFFELSALVWLLYGIKIRSRPLVITEGLWLVAQAVVILEVFQYRS